MAVPEYPVQRPTARRTPLVVAAIAVLAVAAGVLIGVAVASGGSDAGPLAGAPSSTTAGSPVPAGTGSSTPKAKHGKKKRRTTQPNATLGTITTESGSTWTITTTQGGTVHVTVTAQTKFGTKKSPASRTDFTVGRAVAVVGPANGSDGTITATRIRTRDAAGPSRRPSPTASPS